LHGENGGDAANKTYRELIFRRHTQHARRSRVNTNSPNRNMRQWEVRSRSARRQFHQKTSQQLFGCNDNRTVISKRLLACQHSIKPELNHEQSIAGKKKGVKRSVALPSGF
jgi:hypothetical protein